MGRKSKAKGNRGELQFKRLCESYGFLVVRGKEKAEQDTIIDGFGRGEVKYGMHVPKQIYDWLGENDYLAIKRCGKSERRRWLIVIPARLFLQILRELQVQK